MDEPPRRKRLCLTYVITFTLLVLFFYHLMANNRRSIMELTRLREDVKCISEAIKVDCIARKSKFGAIGAAKFAHCDTPPSFHCESKPQNVCVDLLLRRKVGNLLDTVLEIKTQFERVKCERREAQLKLQRDSLIAKSTRINYASEEMGARIIKVIAKPIQSINIFKKLFGMEYSSNPPVNMLRPSLTAGSCFGFRGSKAIVYLNLANTIKVDGFSLSHVAPEKTPTRSVTTAPKEFEIYGIAPDNPKQVFLGRWEYRNDLNIRTEVYGVNNESFYRTLVFVFISNHGANSTCIYSVEVYGNIK